MAMVGFAVACYTVMWFHLESINSSREKGEEENKVEGMSEEEIAEMGDDSPRFRYTI